MRKWIDLLNELSISDFGGDGEDPNGLEMVEVSGICWYDAEGDEVYEDLPTEATIAIEEHRESGEIWVRNAIDHVLEQRFGAKYGAHPAFYDYRFI